MSDNILAILGVQSREDAVTNLLAHCFNSIPEFQSVFLRSTFGYAASNSEKWEAFTRLNLSDAGVPDLVLHGSDQDRSIVVVIENKIKADEGEDQTARYSGPKATELLLRRFQFTEAPKYVFLTLFPYQQPKAGPPWKMTTYRDLLDGFRATRLPDTSVGTRLLSDWLELVAEFYSLEAVAPEDLLLDKLRSDSGLEGNYLYFINFVQQLTLPEGLELEDWFRSSRIGRRYFGAVISKPCWHPEEMIRSPENEWHLDPTMHFNIHIEPQFNVLGSILNLYVHYEINPYAPEHWFVATISVDQQNAYRARRERFIQAFAARMPEILTLGGGRNQIAKATYDFQDVTVAGASTAIEEMIKEIATAVDGTLEELQT